jgi:hypothetical protein
MPFVKRDDTGMIAAVSQFEATDFEEEVAVSDERLVEFLSDLNAGSSLLDSSDQDFIRVLEDVVELLISKGIILFTDLPDSAQQKMMQRQRMRSELQDKLNLIGSD